MGDGRWYLSGGDATEQQLGVMSRRRRITCAERAIGKLRKTEQQNSWRRLMAGRRIDEA